MNAVISLSFSFVLCFSAFGQESFKKTMYVNSKECDRDKVYINPGNIESIKVIKPTQDNEEIHISTKNMEVSFLSLNDVLEKYTALRGNSERVLFSINDAVIDDISGIQIDASYFIQVQVDDLSKVNYLSDNFHGLKIVNIELSSEEKLSDIKWDKDVKFEKSGQE